MLKSTKATKRSSTKTVSKKKQLGFNNRGFSGFFVIAAVLFAVFLAGAFSSISTQNPSIGIADPNNPFKNLVDKKTLQLRTLNFITVTPTATPTFPPDNPNPISPAAPTALCKNSQINDEPDILVGYFPSSGQTVSTGGQIKVWINDEGAPIIAPGEVLNPTTGVTTTIGNRSAKSPDGYLWEPALYIAPQTAETGGIPHFPTAIRGDYNNTTNKGGTDIKVAGMEPVPGNPSLKEQYTAEDIWDVNSLGLAPGTYEAEFVIHDGDDNRGVGCVTITIQ